MARGWTSQRVPRLQRFFTAQLSGSLWSGCERRGMSVTLLVRLLGEVGADADGRPIERGAARQRCVLTALAVDTGRVVPLDRLVERVWGPTAAPRARATLHGYI